MAEGGVGTCPQVFVVDSHSNYVSMPSEKKPVCAKVSQRFLLLLVGLTMLGLVTQGFFIYRLYKKTENLSNPKAPDQQIASMGQVGSAESNEIPIEGPHLEQIQQRPFAHLMGSSNPAGEKNVVQWLHEGGEAITHNMSYDKGRLVVTKEGYYYLYTKVQLNAAEDCLLIQHKVMKDTSAYDRAIELMKSKSFRCRTSKTSGARAVGGDDMWNSFLAGIFHLQRGDKIFVTLENIEKMRSGLTENFMGAFMVSP